MRLLADTHALIWFSEDDLQLSPRAKAALEDPSAAALFSFVSLWGASIKAGLGKLDPARAPGTELRNFLLEHDLIEIPLSTIHLDRLLALPFHHRDPFDRLLAAQALEEGFTIVSRDPSFDRYGVPRLW